MPAYDATRFDPPAPVTAVMLRAEQNGATVSGVQMILDSGADVTLVPRSAISQLGVTATPGRGYELRGFDGTRVLADAVELEMVVLKQTFKGLYLLADGDYGIVGRDVLNHLCLLLDGPHLRWREFGSG